MAIGIANGIGFGKKFSFQRYWTSIISAVVETAVPTNVVITFPSARASLVASDITGTVNGVARTVSSASWTGAVWTIVFASAVKYGDVVVMTFGKTGQTKNVTNNIAYPLAILSQTLGVNDTVAWYKPKDANCVTAVAGVQSIYWDMMYGKEGALGAEQDSGVIVKYAVYKITACQVNFFYTGCVIGDIFPCGTVKTCDANNKVQRFLGNHLTQPTVTNRPTNGVFDGVDNVMKTAPFVLIQPTTIYNSFKQKTWTANDYISDGDASNSGGLYQSAATPSIRLYAGTNSAPLPFKLDTLGIVRIRFNGLVSRFQINEYFVPISGNFGAGTMNGFTLGSYGSGLGSYAHIEEEEIIIRNIVDTEANDADIYYYLKAKTGFKALVIIGDSTVATYLTYVSVESLMDNDNYSIAAMAISGATIGNQKSKWLLLPATQAAKIDCVFVQIGLNDLGLTSAALIAAYQDLITTIRTGIGTQNKIVGVTMNPCNLYTDQQYIDLNEAIRGNGATPITSLDAVIDTVTTALNDGTGALAAAYDTGDHLHENDAGRQILADLYDAQLTAFGL